MRNFALASVGRWTLDQNTWVMGLGSWDSSRGLGREVRWGWVKQGRGKREEERGGPVTK